MLQAFLPLVTAFPTFLVYPLSEFLTPKFSTEASSSGALWLQAELPFLCHAACRREGLLQPQAPRKGLSGCSLLLVSSSTLLHGGPWGLPTEAMEVLQLPPAKPDMGWTRPLGQCRVPLKVGTYIAVGYCLPFSPPSALCLYFSLLYTHIPASEAAPDPR